MKRLLALLLLLMPLCASCTALPAEERAFAVALCVEKEGETWRVHGRIPTYQTGGGYLSVSGEGETLPAALSAMDEAAPMHLHLSQLRLLVLDAALGQSDDLAAALNELAAREDMRPQCAVAVTEASAKDVMDALKPSTGSRLSKSIDVLLDTRIEQGTILSATLADVIRMGERQSPVLMALTLEEGKISLSGGYPFGGMRLGTALTPEETAFLALMRGEARTLHLRIPGGSAQVRDVSAKLRLSEDMQSASVEITLRTTASTLTREGLEQAIAAECLRLLTRLTSEGCDVLGLGRKAIIHADDMAAWHALDWPARCRSLRWAVAVRVQGLA